MLGFCRLPEDFNTRPLSVRNIHFEGPQNRIKWDHHLWEKEKFVHPYFKKS